MKTIKFDSHGHNAPAYSCNKPGDNSGEYVPADVAQELYDALEATRQWMNGRCSNMTLIGVVDYALATADGEDV